MLSLPLCLMLSFPPLVCGIQKNLLFCRLGAYELDIVAVQGMTLVWFTTGEAIIDEILLFFLLYTKAGPFTYYLLCCCGYQITILALLLLLHHMSSGYFFIVAVLFGSQSSQEFISIVLANYDKQVLSFTCAENTKITLLLGWLL